MKLAGPPRCGRMAGLGRPLGNQFTAGAYFSGKIMHSDPQRGWRPRTLPAVRAVVVTVLAGAAWTTGAAQVKADSGPPPYTAADVHFMTGMIAHHAQAVLIAGWAPSHDASAALRTLCERIVVGQRDEIALMERWLAERHESVPTGGPAMAGMDRPMLMPGMLTPEQLAQLDSARGPRFDRLFLEFMIQHHQGALTMVEQLLRTQGAAQDGQVFRFAADVNADQTTEIDRMNRMLASLKRSPQ